MHTPRQTRRPRRGHLPLPHCASRATTLYPPPPTPPIRTRVTRQADLPSLLLDQALAACTNQLARTGDPPPAPPAPLPAAEEEVSAGGPAHALAILVMIHHASLLLPAGAQRDGERGLPGGLTDSGPTAAHASLPLAHPHTESRHAAGWVHTATKEYLQSAGSKRSGQPGVSVPDWPVNID